VERSAASASHLQNEICAPWEAPAAGAGQREDFAAADVLFHSDEEEPARVDEIQHGRVTHPSPLKESTTPPSRGRAHD